ncbi:gliding motility-associated C-terminal domain-containing protein [Flavobacterium silvaticum]|uniref:Gliding motility-associated C-terminal domain-containing protein n=1 Tax=Flavobacterium silvaticum TaxID=1852020 RepID=A0A972FN72_9FLAO|nr:gliding motility-associated C-terminal domain-containing protein [Flavobacterium silvaticum]NMH29154.1 gliding motility-associated C-terminal domain-containing protein [Flavobacterium silvaticum]
MHKLYASRKFRSAFALSLLSILLSGMLNAQVVKPFVQRSSQYTPEKKIYNIKGDFTMLGNTNLSLQNYGNQTQNGNNVMQYVDVDAANLNGLGGIPTFNSSSATLTLSTENGAIPECSNIIYAGLYWTGRAATGAPSDLQFSVTKEIVTGSTPFSNNYPALGHGEAVTATSYNLSVSRTGTANNYSPRYTFSGGGNLYQFNFTNAATNMVSVSVNGGTAVFLPATVSTVGFVKTATLTTPYSFTNAGLTITINQLIRDSRTDRSVVETQQTSKVNLTVSGTTTNTTSYTKNFDKRKLQFRGPGATEYTEITANNNDIYYPVDSNDFMYSAYAEVTDYVKLHGLGEYFAADMALVEGNGGGTGYYGGWGLVVVYENTKMKYRDVTLFDGYAYVIGGTASNELPISGFNTVQSGQVGIKLGIIAGEGDRDITGDYLQIKRNSDGVFQDLNHTANTPDNFFNSSIQVPGTRNPNFLNNTGIDLDMFTVPNPNNSVIANNQNSTTFRYGSIQDTYIIFALAMAVDAYIPEIEGELSAVSINGSPAGSGPYTAEPGQELEFKIKVRNRGTEPLNNAKLIVPIPFNTDYVTGSALNSILFTPLPAPNSLTFDPALGSNGSLVWDIGSLPLPANPDVVLGELTFKLKVTEDCTLLQQTCDNMIQVNGSVSATGSITGISVNNLNLILGYNPNGNCQGNALPAPLKINVDAIDYVNANCQGVPAPVAFTFCTPNATIPITEVSGSFPPGSTFYNEFPVTAESIQYTINNPFPATPGTTTYYAVPPQTAQGCFFAFTITVNSVTETPVAGPGMTYCVGSVASPLTATATNPAHTLYYFSSINGTPQLSITPSTAVAGTFTYYVAEGNSFDCYGPKVEITVTVVPGITITAPANVPFEGCGTDAITGLAYSETPVAITVSQFIAAGGSVSDAELADGEVILYSDVRSGNCPILVTRTFSIDGACGQQSVTQQITIQDLTPPVISTLPAPSVTDGCTGTPDFTTPTASDNCEGLVTLTFADETVHNGCATTITRTWTALDLCGNPATASQSITFNDNTPPVFEVLPEPSTIGCGETPSFETAVATDSCSPNVTLSFVDSQAPGTCPGSIVYTRTWTALDVCQNTSTAQQIITSIDDVPPVITTQAQDLFLECNGEDTTEQIQTWLSQNGGAIATDACSDITWTNDFDTTPTSCSDAVTIIFVATDSCGNQSYSEAHLQINDNLPPVLPQIPGNLDLTCDDAIPAAQPLTATDACVGAITATPAETETPGACQGSRIITRTWTFTDSCENTVSASQTITINDTTAPALPQIPGNLILSCGDTVPSAQPITATDACSGDITATPVETETPGTCEGSRVITRTWTFTDACENTVSASQTITINDTTPPVLPEVPASIILSCGDSIPAAQPLTATDACSGDITATPTETETAGTCPGTSIIARTWTFTDACDNTVSATQTITINDTTPPVLPEIPGSVNLSCAADVPQNVTLTATDECSGETISATGVDVTTAGSCANSFTTIRTWTFTDSCNNTISASQTINVNDTIAPVFTFVPENTTAECGDEPVFGTPVVTDNCIGEVTLTYADETVAGSCVGSSVITRTWTATDVCNNQSTASQSITFTDTVAPVITTQASNLNVNCSTAADALQAWLDSNGGAAATDSCSAVTWTNTYNGQTGSCGTAVEVIFTATDACQNQTTTTASFTITDTEAPVAPQAPENITLSCAGNVPAPLTLIAIDACSGEIAATSTDTVVTGECVNNFVINRTWTFTDDCDNSVSITQTIIVNDTEMPVVPEAPADVTVSCTSLVPVGPVLTAVDGCANEQIEATPFDVVTPGSCPNSYTILRTWSFSDTCKNAVSIHQTITVNDNEAPVFATEIPSDVTLNCEDIPSAPIIMATDNCNTTEFAATLTETTATGTCAGNYTLTRTWTATDACNNTATATQVITVHDVTGPVATDVPADITLECGDTVPTGTPLSATDTCSGATVTANPVDSIAAGSCVNSYTITRTWTFTDACNNTTTATQIISVQDNQAPEFAVDMVGEITVNCGEVPVAPQYTATDACNNTVIAAVLTETSVPGTCPEVQTITRTWTASDACNNSQSISQIIHVMDLNGPVLDSPLDSVVNVTCDAIPAVPELTFSDACSEVGAALFSETSTDPVSGSYTITRTWTATDSCNNSSIYTQIINVTPLTISVPASAYAACNDDTSLILDLTASLPENTPAGGTFVDVDNTGAVQGSSFVPNGLNVGDYHVDYVTGDQSCPSSIVRITVSVDDDCQVLDECEPVVHNAFSPNGDGKNDIFVIESFDNLDCIIDNNVEIYNRWGVLVFEMNKYDNNTRAFRGYSDGRATVKKGDELPAGTYFYIIKYTKADGTNTTKDGYLYLSR